jgi:hypothetical protein
MQGAQREREGLRSGRQIQLSIRTTAAGGGDSCQLQLLFYPVSESIEAQQGGENTR